MKILQLANKKIESLVRQLHVRGLPKLLGSYTINEYPKSGGSWVGKLMADALQLPFPQHQIPEFKASILHGHYINPWGMNNVTCVWRDGRDVTVSWYFHCTHKFKFGNEFLVDKVVRDLNIKDIADVQTNLPRFIEYSFVHQTSPHFSWSDFVRVWSDRDVIHVKYENFLEDTVGELVSLYGKLTDKHLSLEEAQRIVDKNSFQRMSGRIPGTQESSSFFRKGIAGDWKNYFNEEAVEIFKHYGGKELVHLGYETDMSWGFGE